MTPSAAKQRFAYLMQVARARPLKPIEKRELTTARQTLRGTARSAMNPKNVPSVYRFLCYAIARNHKDLIRVVVNQTNAVKATRDAKNHSAQFGESWLYMVTDNKQQLLIAHFIKGQSAPTTAPNPKRTRKATMRSTKNPGKTTIYGRCLRIEAIKTVPHTYGGKRAAPGQKYWHDFSTKNAIIYGLPDGSLLIKAK